MAHYKPYSYDQELFIPIHFEKQILPGIFEYTLNSNIADNEPARLETSKGVIQGYDGVTAVDGKHQVIVAAETFGQSQEHDLLEPMVDQVQDNFK